MNERIIMLLTIIISDVHGNINNDFDGNNNNNNSRGYKYVGTVLTLLRLFGLMDITP